MGQGYCVRAKSSRCQSVCTCTSFNDKRFGRWIRWNEVCSLTPYYQLSANRFHITEKGRVDSERQEALCVKSRARAILQIFISQLSYYEWKSVNGIMARYLYYYIFCATIPKRRCRDRDTIWNRYEFLFWARIWIRLKKICAWEVKAVATRRSIHSPRWMDSRNVYNRLMRAAFRSIVDCVSRWRV